MKIRTFCAYALGVMLTANLLVGYSLYAKEKTAVGDGDDVFIQIDRLMEIVQHIREDYVDKDKTEADKLFSGAIQGMLKTLDPFSDYLEGEDKEEFEEQISGQYGGVGIETEFRDDYAVVVRVQNDTPAFRGGLRRGDVLYEIDGRKIKDLGQDGMIRQMRGEAGTTVRILFMREGFKEPRTLELQRAVIPVESVVDAKILDGGIGYVSIVQFIESTPQELEKVLKETFSGEAVKGLVIDLRNNPGGLVASAWKICSFFLKTDTFVASTEGRRHTEVMRALNAYKFKDIPIALLVNRRSASAAEIMSGCLQFQKRAFLVGEKTFGKGSVQNIIPLRSGKGDLKLTIAYYYIQPAGTPKRKRIHGIGLMPDEAVTYSRKERKALEADVTAFTKSLDNEKLGEKERLERIQAYMDAVQLKDKVLHRAVEILAGRRTIGEKDPAEPEDAVKDDVDAGRPEDAVKDDVDAGRPENAVKDDVDAGRPEDAVKDDEVIE